MDTEERRCWTSFSSSSSLLSARQHVHPAADLVVVVVVVVVDDILAPVDALKGRIQLAIIAQPPTSRAGHGPPC